MATTEKEEQTGERKLAAETAAMDPRVYVDVAPATRHGAVTLTIKGPAAGDCTTVNVTGLVAGNERKLAAEIARVLRKAGLAADTCDAIDLARALEDFSVAERALIAST